MALCGTCGSPGAACRSRSGLLICFLCAEEEVYGRNDWLSSSKRDIAPDPLTLLCEKLRNEPIEDFLRRRRLERGIPSNVGD